MSGREGNIRFTYRKTPYTIIIGDVISYPQDYAAAMTIYPEIKRHTIARVNSEFNLLLSEEEIDDIILERRTDFEERVQTLVRNVTAVFVDDLLGALRERGLDLRTGCVAFVGGGTMLGFIRDWRALQEIQLLNSRIHPYIKQISVSAKIPTYPCEKIHKKIYSYIKKLTK